MSGGLSIGLGTETLAHGAPEEKATFGQLSVVANGRHLAFGFDTLRRKHLEGPYVSGFPLAEWFAWNWWRLMWECERPTSGIALTEEKRSNWEMAHRMTAVGYGYVWPDITITCDGYQASLNSKESEPHAGVPFWFQGVPGDVEVAASELETAIDTFVTGVIKRLASHDDGGNDLSRIWADVVKERSDEELSQVRKVEAQLGLDPDELSDDAIAGILQDQKYLGEDAVAELAADSTDGVITSARSLEVQAQRAGREIDLRDAVSLESTSSLPKWGAVDAWRVGMEAARLLRKQERLAAEPMKDHVLTTLVGTMASLNSVEDGSTLSFVLQRTSDRGSLVLRSSTWGTPRRFDLARILGDHLAWTHTAQSDIRLVAATNAYTYRQKVQRAFAAELLSPIAAVDDFLEGDYSEDRQQVAAAHFGVSPWTINWQLVNHGNLGISEALALSHTA